MPKAKMKARVKAKTKVKPKPKVRKGPHFTEEQLRIARATVFGDPVFSNKMRKG